jgi:hypothetical protein
LLHASHAYAMQAKDRTAMASSRARQTVHAVCVWPIACDAMAPTSLIVWHHAHASQVWTSQHVLEVPASYCSYCPGFFSQCMAVLFSRSRRSNSQNASLPAASHFSFAADVCFTWSRKHLGASNLSSSVYCSQGCLSMCVCLDPKHII